MPLQSDILFYLLGGLTLSFGLMVIVLPNPVYAALSLAASMVCVGGLFWTLEALFLAVVQWAVYAGAVIVLFVMIMMLFDLKDEKRVFSRGVISGFFKLSALGIFFGIAGNLVYRYFLTPVTINNNVVAMGSSLAETTKSVSQLLFSKYVFGFEAISILLLMVVIGVVALAKSKGGSHD